MADSWAFSLAHSRKQAYFVRNELDTTLKLHTHTVHMEVSCADLKVGRVPKALTIRLRRIVGRFPLLTLVSKLTSFAMN
jgi:hypothetical protein